MNIEKTILSNLIFSEEYCRKILPFLKEDYFSGSEKVLFNLIGRHVEKYNSLPTKEVLNIELDNIEVREQTYKEVKEYISDLSVENSDLAWLIDSTEKFCQDKAIHNALRKSIDILENENNFGAKGGIPEILSQPLS